MKNIKVYINRLKYRMQIARNAVKFSEKTKNFKVILDIRKSLHNKYLKIERESRGQSGELKIIEAQKEIIDKILDYVFKR